MVSFWGSNDKVLWNHYMGGAKGDVSEPEHVYVPAREQWGPGSPWYLLRTSIGRYRCPACGKPYFFMDSAWNCHLAASAYELWQKFAHRGPAGAASMSDVIRGASATPTILADTMADLMACKNYPVMGGGA